MVKNERYYRDKFIIPMVFVLLALMVWLGMMREFRLDDSFITYRYAQNTVRGLGLVYNEGDTVLSTTAPLYALILAALSILAPDFHLLGGLIGSVSIGVGGWLMAVSLPRRIPFSIRSWAGLLYVFSSILWLSLGMETALWIMLVLAAIHLRKTHRLAWAGAVIGLATLTRPDALVPGALLGISAFVASFTQFNTRRRWWLPSVAYSSASIVPIALFSLWAWATYGSPLPVTLGAKSAQAYLGITGFGPFVSFWDGLILIAQGLLAQSPLYITFALLALFGVSSRLNTSGALIVAWGGLHLIAYLMLGVAPYRWYYAPLLPASLILMAHGIDHIHIRLRARNVAPARVIVAAVALFPLIAELCSLEQVGQRLIHGGSTEIMLPIVDWDTYRQVGDWLRVETPSDSTVGVAEVGQVGFYAERWMTDYLGLLQPDVSRMLERGDLYSWLAGYAPDYLVFQRFRGAPLVLYNYLIGDDPWFRASYQPVTEFDDPRYASGPVTVFERTSVDKPVLQQAVQADFGGLRLLGLATDGYDLTQAGGPVRVRLDWQVSGQLPANLHIAVKGLQMPQIPAYDGDYHTVNWHGAFSTWHGFVVPEAIAPDGYPLEVSIGPTGGPYLSQTVGWLDLSYPKVETPYGGAVLTHNQAQLRLTAADITLSDNALILDMNWRADTDISSDFSYFVHLTLAGSDTPVMQVDSRPNDGSYPTFLWQEGEQVPIQVILNELPTSAGEYDVYVGWYRPSDGLRFVNVHGDDRLRVAHLMVNRDGSAIISQIVSLDEMS